jgi:hypothetical protein
MNTNKWYRSKRQGNFVVFLEEDADKMIWYAFKHKTKEIWHSYYNEEHPEFKTEDDVYDHFYNVIVPLYESGKSLGKATSPTDMHRPQPIESLLELHLKLHNQ